MRILGKKLLGKYLIMEYSLKIAFKDCAASVSNFFNRLGRLIPTLDFNSQFFHLIQLLLALVYLYYIILIPFELSFSQNSRLRSTDTLLIIILVFEILVTISSKVMDSGTILRTRKNTISQYL